MIEGLKDLATNARIDLSRSFGMKMFQIALISQII